MASQRITIAKIGGRAADVALQRLREWSAARLTHDPNEWSSEQWPSHLREKVDAFADQLRAHAFALPVIHFVEWADTWSMGNLFGRWLSPPDGPAPLVVHANRHTLFAYALPDGGRLVRYLATAGPQQFEEADWFIARLREAVGAWDQLAERSALVVLRYVVGLPANDPGLAGVTKAANFFAPKGRRGIAGAFNRLQS